ncbi:MAG: hypothetical protein QW727_03745 [Candidatus Pacearchaeota archaeon]
MTETISNINDFRFDEIINHPLSYDRIKPGFRSYLKESILRKYYGEQSNWHPHELVWPGYNGLPVVGSYFHIRNEEAHTVIPVKYFYSKIFDISDEKDKEHFDWVMDRIQSGWFSLNFIDRKWVENIDENGRNKIKIVIYMEWVQYYSKFPRI